MSPAEIAAAVWLVLILLAMPVVAFLSGRALRARAGNSARAQRVSRLPREALYSSSMINLGAIFLITLLLDAWDHGSVVRKSLAFPASGWLWVVGCIAFQQVRSISTMLIRRRRGLALDPGVARMLPRTPRERVFFAGLSLMAGISEEFLYRGFALGHLLRWGLPMVVAVALVNLSFGFAHGYKGLAGMLRAALGGLVLTIPVLVTGTLLPSIVAHALMDLISGAVTLRLARRLNVEIPEEAPVTA